MSVADLQLYIHGFTREEADVVLLGIDIVEVLALEGRPSGRDVNKLVSNPALGTLVGILAYFSLVMMKRGFISKVW